MELIDEVISADESDNNENFLRGRGGDLFEEEQTIAMLDASARSLNWRGNVPRLDYAIVTFLNWEDLPRTNPRRDSLIPLRLHII